MKKILVFVAVALILPVISMAENANPNIRSGNRLYRDGKFVESETEYRKGLQKDNKSVESSYNLGNALYGQGKYKEAADAFKNASVLTKDKEKLASIYHNMGNSYYMAEDYGQSVEAYKSSLKNNPKDEETRFNLALAQQKLQQQQQQQQNQDQMDKETAEQILNAFAEQEEDTQEKLQQKPSQRSLEKDW